MSEVQSVHGVSLWTSGSIGIPWIGIRHHCHSVRSDLFTTVIGNLSFELLELVLDLRLVPERIDCPAPREIVIEGHKVLASTNWLSRHGVTYVTVHKSQFSFGSNFSH